MAKQGASRKGPRRGGLRRVLDAVAGARLCYGEPVTLRDRTVIPVARLRFSGGGGWGNDAGDGAEGGGGGGFLDARPMGFVELDDAGARYHPIPDPDQLGRTLRAVAAATAALAGALAGARVAQGARRRLASGARRSPAALLRR